MSYEPSSDSLSIILPAYNGELFIKEQVVSILCDLSENDELLISDDNSSDATLSIINSFDDTRVKVFIQEKNLGLNKNIEFLIGKASYPNILLSDQDDVWLAGRSSLFRNALKSADLIIDDCVIVDSNLSVIKGSYRSVYPFSNNLISNFIRCRFLGCCMGFKKRVAELAFPIPRNYIGHDLCIGATAIIYGFSIITLDRKLLLYRRHSKALSFAGRIDASILSHIFPAIIRRFILLNYLIRQFIIKSFL